MKKKLILSTIATFTIEIYHKSTKPNWSKDTLCKNELNKVN